MKLQSRHAAFFFLISVFVSSFANAQTNVDKKDLPNFGKVNEMIYRGGQPDEKGLAELSKMGVKTVINLRGDDDKAKREDDWATKAGMKFINVSLGNWLKPKDEDIEKIVELLNQAENQPVFIHCKRGSDRTGTVIAVYRMTHDRWSAKQAIDEAKNFGFGWWQVWMKDYINDYYDKLEKRKTNSASN